jgi:hypothetical protein
MTAPLFPQDPRTAWYAQMGIAQEMGGPALLSLGLEPVHTEALTTLLALRQTLRRQQPAALPWVLVGGEGEIWLIASLLGAGPQPFSPQAVTPMTGQSQPQFRATLFAGSDPATYAASLLITAPDAPVLRPSLLPQGMVWMLTAAGLPGGYSSGVAELPFALMAAPPPDPMPSRPSLAEGISAWLTLLFALALILWAGIGLFLG